MQLHLAPSRRKTNFPSSSSPSNNSLGSPHVSISSISYHITLPLPFHCLPLPFHCLPLPSISSRSLFVGLLSRFFLVPVPVPPVVSTPKWPTKPTGMYSLSFPFRFYLSFRSYPIHKSTSYLSFFPSLPFAFLTFSFFTSLLFSFLPFFSSFLPYFFYLILSYLTLSLPFFTSSFLLSSLSSFPPLPSFLSLFIFFITFPSHPFLFYLSL